MVLHFVITVFILYNSNIVEFTYFLYTQNFNETCIFWNRLLILYFIDMSLILLNISFTSIFYKTENIWILSQDHAFPLYSS